MFTHRTSTPGRTGSNDGYGVDATFSFYQNLHFDGYLARHAERRQERRRPELPRRSPTTTPTSTACRPSGSKCSRTSFRRSGSCAVPTSAATSACVRYSPRPKGVPHVRKFTDAGQPQLHDQQRRTASTRASRSASSRPSSRNSDVAGVTYTDNFERLVRPFAIAPGIRIPVGDLQFPHAAALVHRRAAAQVVRRHRLRDRRRSTTATGQSIALNSARLEVTPQLSLEPSLQVELGGSRRGRVHRHGRAHARHLHGDAAHVRERHRPVQLDRTRRWAATSASGGSTVPAASCSSSTRTITTPRRCRRQTACATGRFVVKLNRLFRP